MMKRSQTFWLGLVFMTVAGFTFLVTGAGFAACPDDIVSYWKLDETGGPDYSDFIGDNDGTGSADPTAATGTVNGAQEFDGATTGIDVDPSHTFGWLGTESFSIEVWVKTDGVAPGTTNPDDNEVFIGRNDAVSGLQWWVGLANTTGNASFFMTDGAGNTADMIGDGVSLTDDTDWHHVVVVRDGISGNINLYVDGTVQGAGDTVADFAAGLSPQTAALNIGNLGGGFRFDGSLDEVALYDKALTLAEIQAHNAAGVGGNDICGGSDAPSDAPFPDDTISLWPLDEAAGSTYVDAFGDNDGTGSADPTAATGTVNGAQEFDGATTGIDVDASHTFGWLGTESFSIEVWVKTDGVAPGTTNPDDNEVFIGRNDAVSGLQWWVGLANTTGNASFYMTDGVVANSADMIGVGASLTDDTDWHHVVVVRDGTSGNINLYVDGTLQGAGVTVADFTAGLSSQTAALTIGYLDTGGGFNFDGLIDEVALYDRALEQPEIEDHFDAGVAGDSVTSLRPEPVAVAAADPSSVTEGATATLDGRGSTDADGTIETYLWEEVGTSLVTLTPGTGALLGTATFTAPNVGASGTTLTFRLTVTDNDGLSSSDTVNVTVRDSSVAPPAGDGGGGGGCFISTMF